MFKVGDEVHYTGENLHKPSRGTITCINSTRWGKEYPITYIDSNGHTMHFTLEGRRMTYGEVSLFHLTKLHKALL